MGTSRAIGALLCIGCGAVAVLYILAFIARWIPIWIFAPYDAPLWIAIPVFIGVLVLAGLGLWLGWIMASTKEISPAAPVSSTKETEKKEAEKKK